MNKIFNFLKNSGAGLVKVVSNIIVGVPLFLWVLIEEFFPYIIGIGFCAGLYFLFGEIALVIMGWILAIAGFVVLGGVIYNCGDKYFNDRK